MSFEDFALFKATGKIPATGETFISPTKAFAADYGDVLVQFNVKKGTQAQLEQIGVRNMASSHTMPNLPLVESGWNANNAFFKFETNANKLSQINIGLGKGPALEIFNNNIQSFKVLKKP